MLASACTKLWKGTHNQQLQSDTEHTAGSCNMESERLAGHFDAEHLRI